MKKKRISHYQQEAIMIILFFVGIIVVTLVTSQFISRCTTVKATKQDVRQESIQQQNNSNDR